MENGPFEDVFPIGNGDIPASYVSLPEGKITHAPMFVKDHFRVGACSWNGYQLIISLGPQFFWVV